MDAVMSRILKEATHYKSVGSAASVLPVPGKLEGAAGIGFETVPGT
jgi:hypothetical protein